MTYYYSDDRWLQYLKKKVESLYHFFESEDLSIVEREHTNDGLLEVGSEELLKCKKVNFQLGFLFIRS